MGLYNTFIEEDLKKEAARRQALIDGMWAEDENKKDEDEEDKDEI